MLLSFFKTSTASKLLILSCVVVLNATTHSLAGTSALVKSAGGLFHGPGINYTSTGAVEAESEITVERCLSYWCKVSTTTSAGWMERAKISFGQHARGAMSGPKFTRKSGGPGEVCLYTGKQFSGQSLCRGSGFVIQDLSRSSLDNRFSSVTVSGDVSVMVCRDFFFSSFCEHVTTDTAVLPPLLKGEVSSIRIY